MWPSQKSWTLITYTLYKFILSQWIFGVVFTFLYIGLSSFYNCILCIELVVYLLDKVQLFWEGHKNLELSFTCFDIYLVNQLICQNNWAEEQQTSWWVIAPWWLSVSPWRIYITLFWPRSSLKLKVLSSWLERYLHFALLDTWSVSH